MKIASGEMCDQEIIINSNANLIIIGEGNNYKTNVSDEGFTSYSIPSEQEPFTFSIISHEGQIAIDLHTKDQSKIIPINLHEMVLKDLFPFVIKHIDTPWENFTHEETVQSDLVITKKSKYKFKKTLYIKKICVGISIIALAFISFMLIQDNSQNTIDKKNQAIGNVISGNHHPTIITEGKNNQFLILVKTQRDLDWSTQRLLKSKYRNDFTVNNMAKLEREIEDKISESIPHLLKIDINTPCNPIIKISDKTVSEEHKKIINRTLLSYFKCYKGSEFRTSNINELIKKSEL